MEKETILATLKKAIITAKTINPKIEQLSMDCRAL